MRRKERKNKKRQELKKRLRLQKELQYCTDFNFLRDAQVIEYIKRSKVMFIMRGLPGSGKSTIVKSIQKVYNRAVVCSADFFFHHGGRYEYDASKLNSAHNQCQERAKSACKNGRRVVVIDNTNIRKWEMKFYLQLAVEKNYVVVTVLPKASWSFDPTELANHNKHNVPADVINKKMKTFEDTIPLYYGWFLNELDSKQLLEFGHEIYQECLKNVPDFATTLGCIICNDNRRESNNILEKYFTRYSAAVILHCTATFCRWGKEDGARRYHQREVVQKSRGQTYRLNVKSLVITPRTLAFRIQLTECQLKLWGQTDREKQHLENKLVENYSRLSLVYSGDWSDQQLNQTTSQICVDEQNSLSTKRLLPNTKSSHLSAGIGRSAHITLGCAQGIPAKQSGLDILEIADLPYLGRNSHFSPIQTGHGVIHYYGEGRCEIILEETLKVNSLFSGFY